MMKKATAMVRSSAFQVEVAVIGAGVIGLAIGRALAMIGKEVIIMDRAGTIGSETSSRNSEVIHAGLYYPRGSKKADFCVRGKEMLYEYCQSRSIAHQNCGKLIVATQPDQLQHKLSEIQQKAIQNGVNDTRILTLEDVKILEPSLQCVGALWSPSTGVVDSHSFMLSLLADAEEHGAILALHSHLAAAAATTTTTEETSSNDPSSQQFSLGSQGCISLPLDDPDGNWLECKTVINSAGLWAHHVARAIHRYNNHPQSWNIPKQYYAKGNYFRLEGIRNPFSHLVYPLPEPAGLGVHATIDWSGQSVKFGPDVEWVDVSTINPDDIDLTPNPQRSEGFYGEVRKYWPDLPDQSLVPDYAGIRPKLAHPSDNNNNNSVSFHDFWIATPDEHGIAGLIHLFGMESPGLTSSMAIAEHVANQVKSWD